MPTLQLHQSPLINRVKCLVDMFANNELLDLEIICCDSSESGERCSIRAHKVVLAAMSPVLRKMMSGNFAEAGQNSISVDIEHFVMKKFLQFVYTGFTEVSTLNEIVKLGQVADHFDIEQLRDCALRMAIESISAETCALLLQSSSRYGLSTLEDHARTFFCRNFSEVAKSEGFLELDEDVLATVISSDELFSPNEETVYEHLKRWITAPLHADANSADGAAPADASELRGLQLLRHIRFPLMDGKYLAQEIHQSQGALARTALLKDLTTEAALWQLVPASSKAQFRRRALSDAAFRCRCRPDLWRPHCLRAKQVLQGQDEVQALVVVDGRLVTASVDATICVWNTHTWRVRAGRRALSLMCGCVCASLCLCPCLCLCLLHYAFVCLCLCL